MSSTGIFAVTKPDSTEPKDKPASVRAPRVPRQRRWWLLSASLGLIIVSVAGTVAVVSAAWDREPMLQLVRDVAWGQPIRDADMTTVELPPSARQFGVADAGRSRVVGQIAAANLRAGHLLAFSDVTTQVVPARGQQVIGVRLPPGRYPARGLAPNDPVEVVGLSSSGTTSETVAGGTGFQARVVQTSPPDSEGAIVVDLLIDSSASEQADSTAAGGALVKLLGPAH
ncbi:SAF domain-containing protein [Saccharopolyspora shandongensis]|uniref:SAF domain-containing protein n=1 Tax=Saccharopolyspora shandongensis TaxID=418495 RepID=A0A1H3GCK1_9PSEU|nr:SAF domain-containing protein [Saccharopolyspora shandongensis]SDY01016.1 SAF domain-containing protein [Saccharopolyspora shandongensis]